MNSFVQFSKLPHAQTPPQDDGDIGSGSGTAGRIREKLGDAPRDSWPAVDDLYQSDLASRYLSHGTGRREISFLGYLDLG